MFALRSVVFSSHCTISGVLSVHSLEIIALYMYNFESSPHLSPFSFSWQLMRDNREIHIIEKNLYPNVLYISI